MAASSEQVQNPQAIQTTEELHYRQKEEGLEDAYFNDVFSNMVVTDRESIGNISEVVGELLSKAEDIQRNLETALEEGSPAYVDTAEGIWEEINNYFSEDYPEENGEFVESRLWNSFQPDGEVDEHGSTFEPRSDNIVEALGYLIEETRKGVDPTYAGTVTSDHISAEG